MRRVLARVSGRRRQDERGMVLVWFCMLLVVLLGMCAFSVDTGSFYARGAQIQRAADAAAMAGVVYMPGEFAQAQSIAQGVARINGFDPAVYTVTVAPVTGNDHRLQVTITDPSVRTWFAGVFGISSITETRTAVAEYSMAIPLGSPENSFGTGNQQISSGVTTNIWGAVNGYCTSRENGDEFLSRFDRTWNGSSYACPTNGPSGLQVYNSEYSANGYYYAIVTGEQPPQTPTILNALKVDAYDPAYEPSGSCSVTGGSTPDTNSLGGSTITTTYTLYYVPVPLDHSQDQAVPGVNPKSFSAGDSASCGKWTNLFTIPAGQPSGQYRVAVATSANQTNSSGSNAYGLRIYENSFARCTTISGSAFYSSSCPVIHGEQALSVYLNQSGGTATFYLAQIGTQYAGHVMNITLFDPGEGSNTLQILDPSGNPVSFTYATTDDNTGQPDSASNEGFSPISGGPTTSLNVNQTMISQPSGFSSKYKFNDRHLSLTVAIPSNYTAPNGGWYSIKYNATSSVTDRTTWSVGILGSPVHLVQ